GVKDYKIVNVGDLDIDLLKGVKAFDYTDKEITRNIEVFFRHKNDEELLDIFLFLEEYINEVGDYYIVYKIVNSLLNTSYQEMLLKVILDVDQPTIEGAKDIIYSAGDEIPNFLEGLISYKKYDEDIIIDLTDRIKVKILDKKDNTVLEIEEIDFNIINSYII